MPQLKRGKILVAFHNFLKIPGVAKKYLKDNETQKPPFGIKMCSDMSLGKGLEIFSMQEGLLACLGWVNCQLTNGNTITDN